MRATLSDMISVPYGDMPDLVRAQIESSLTIANPQKAVAIRELVRDAEKMDDWIRLYSYSDGVMNIPMGFLGALITGCSALSIPLELNDRRTMGQPLGPTRPIQLRDYQEPFAKALIERQLGVAEAPTAAGKTAATLGAIQRVGRNGLIIVDKKSLATQWLDSISNFYGVDGDMLDDRWSPRYSPITLGLRQNIYSNVDELRELGFFSHFGVVAVDEAHHAATATTLIEILQLFTSFFRWGVTATPYRDKDYFPVMEAVIGPVVWKTTIEDARAHLVLPSIDVINTDFEFDYVGAHKVKNERTGRERRVSNNYNEMMGALCDDDRRNAQIADRAKVEADAGHHVLIVSKRLEHLKRISSHIGRPCFMLTGKSSKSDFEAIRDAILTWPEGTILLSTVADEGLSIDRLDRVISAYPRRNHETMRQIVGRVMRPYEGKTDAKVIDVRDARQPVLRSQFLQRAQMLYAKEGWNVER